jgi:hypothetical protein
MSETHTVQAFAESHAKLFLKKNSDCGYDLLDLQFLVNFAVLEWENPSHQKFLCEHDHHGMKSIMKLFLRNPPIASKWIELICNKWKNLPEQKQELMRRKKGVRGIQDNTTENKRHYDERHLRRIKAELEKAEVALEKNQHKEVDETRRVWEETAARHKKNTEKQQAEHPG